MSQWYTRGKEGAHPWRFDGTSLTAHHNAYDGLLGRRTKLKVGENMEGYLFGCEKGGGSCGSGVRIRILFLQSV